MKDEAIDACTASPASRVVVTGAAAFDHWFDWRPGTTRDEFCALRWTAAGGSVRALRLLIEVRGAGRGVVRAHLAWTASRVGGRASATPACWSARTRRMPSSGRESTSRVWGPSAIWPRAGAAPADARTRSDYFDSIFHSAAVVGDQHHRRDRERHRRASDSYGADSGVPGHAGGHPPLPPSARGGRRRAARDQ